MKLNTTLDLTAIVIVAFSIFSLSGCSMFKPGTAKRMETIAIEGEVEDEVKELEGDLIHPEQKPIRKKHASN